MRFRSAVTVLLLLGPLTPAMAQHRPMTRADVIGSWAATIEKTLHNSGTGTTTQMRGPGTFVLREDSTWSSSQELRGGDFKSFGGNRGYWHVAGDSLVLESVHFTRMADPCAGVLKTVDWVMPYTATIDSQGLTIKYVGTDSRIDPPVAETTWRRTGPATPDQRRDVRVGPAVRSATADTAFAALVGKWNLIGPVERMSEGGVNGQPKKDVKHILTLRADSTWVEAKILDGRESWVMEPEAKSRWCVAADTLFWGSGNAEGFRLVRPAPNQFKTLSWGSAQVWDIFQRADSTTP